MIGQRLVVVLAILGWFGVVLAGMVGCLGVLMPWAYPRNVLGVRSALAHRLAWLPGIDGDSPRVETGMATLLVLGLAWGLFRVSLAVNPAM